MSTLVRHYRWAPDFWRRMGRLEFYAWVNQAHRELQQQQGKGNSWDATKNDNWWQQARDKRRKRQGR